MTARGTLVLVVGSAGAGKNTLIAAAAAARPDLHVARGVETGTCEVGGLSDAAFGALRRAGRLALEWQAEGHRFGLRDRIAPRLAAGQHVLAHASCSAIPAARARYAPCRIVEVTAPEALRRARLARRGAPARTGWARSREALPEGTEAVLVENSGALDAALARFMAALPPSRGETA